MDKAVEKLQKIYEQTIIESDQVKSYVEKFGDKMKGSSQTTSAGWVDYIAGLSDKDKLKIWKGIQKYVGKEKGDGELPKWVK